MQLGLLDLGLVDYLEAKQVQKETFTQVEKNGNSVLILCRHYPVITCGRQSKRENILVSTQELQKKGIALYETERGGDVTYHGPGQLIAYPVFNLNYFKKDIGHFLRQLEGVVISLLSGSGLTAKRRAGFTGAWIGDCKIASIGIAIKKWITYHGLSINVKKDDMANFSLIRPCGMDIKMACLEAVLGYDIKIDSLTSSLFRKFRDVFLGCS